MDGEFHEASVMGHDILGLSPDLDSFLSLLGLDTCNESIYSSGLGLEDIHHEGSVIDFSLVDSSQTGFEEDLEIAPITLDGLIPFLASHQCPTPPHSSGSGRVKTRTGDYVTFDSQVASSVEESGLVTNFLNDAVSTSLSDTQLTFFNNVTPSLRGQQGKSATSSYSEASDCTTSSLNDVISSTSLSTSPLGCLSEDRILSKGLQGEANTSFNSEGAILLDASGNVSSSLNDTFVSTNQNTNQLTSLKRVRSPSRSPQGPTIASLDNEASGNVTSLLNDAVFSTNSSTCPVTSLNKVRTPSIHVGHQGKANASFNSEGAIFIEASGNVRNFLNNVVISTSMGNTPLASFKRDSTPSKTFQEKGVVLEKSKTSAPRGSPSHMHVSKTRSKRKHSSAKAVSSTTSGPIGLKAPQQKEQKQFKCSTCGAVYKSHALCVNHVLDRHKVGMRVKHRVSGSRSRNTPGIHLKQPVKVSCVVPHGKSSSCASSEDSSILTRQMKMAESDIDLKNNVAPNGKSGKNRETSTDRKSGPTQLERTPTTVESKCLAGSKRQRSKSPRSCKGTPKVKPRSWKESQESGSIDSSAFTPKDVGCQVMEDECDVSDITSVQDQKQSLTTTASKKKGVACKQKRNHGGTESHTSSSKRDPEPFKEVARKKRKLEPVSIERVAHLLHPRPRRQMKIAESDIDSRNDPSPDRKFGKNLEKETDRKCGSMGCRRAPSTGESKYLAGSKRIRSQSPRSRKSTPKVSPQPWKESQERALIDSSDFARKDVHVGRQETKSSNVTTVQDLKQAFKSSASKEKCLAHTEKRDNRGRPNETKSQKCSSERDPRYHKEVPEKRTKEVSGGSERTVYLLDPRKMTIVICPRCQKAFTTYMGYSLHAAQVHNVSANDAPGKLLQLLVQRSPQYCSKTTPDQGLDEPKDDGLRRKSGICREMVGKSVCTSSDAFSSTVKKHMSDQSQLAVKMAQTETSDSLGAISYDSSEGILCAKSTQTDISFLEEPFCDQRKENRRIWQIDDLRTDVHEGNSGISLDDEDNAGTNQKVVPVTSSTLYDLQPSDRNHEQSVKMRSKTSTDQMNETSTMIKHGGSLLCECCGVIFKDLSGLDDKHQLGSVPGELVCEWTAGVKAMEESSFLCSTCGIHISSLTDLGSHSASCGVVVQDSAGVDDSDQIVSAPGGLMRPLTAQEEAIAGNDYFCSVCRISIPSPGDFRSHSCDISMSVGVHHGMSASPSSKPRVDVGDPERLSSRLMCVGSKGDVQSDKTVLKEYQGLFDGFPGVAKGDQPLDRRATSKRINAGTNRSVIRKQPGSVSHATVRIPQKIETPGNPGHVSLDHMPEQCHGLLNESTGVIEAEKKPRNGWHTLKRMNVGAARRLNMERIDSSSHATVKMPQGMENSYDVSLDSMLEQCQRMLKESADVLGDGSI
eukprot:XP_003725020.1 PREDICTED: uncharacterized protein LOC100890098 isoform X2 [Strongylocentrotus purpuratus]